MTEYKNDNKLFFVIVTNMDRNHWNFNSQITVSIIFLKCVILKSSVGIILNLWLPSVNKIQLSMVLTTLNN